MPLYEQEIVKVDLVLVGVRLLSEPQQVSAFTALTGRDVVSSGTDLVSMEQGVLDPVTRLELPKDRIVLGLGSQRSTIERTYPDEDDLPRFADIVTLAARCSNFNSALVAVHGYNLAMVYRQDSGMNTLRYLGKHMFGEAAFAAEGWNPVGGTGKLLYESPDGRWEFFVEPRLQKQDTDKVFLQLNLHRGQATIPSREEIIDSLNFMWKQAQDLAHRIDQRVLA
jgi:hypothetical protein